MTVYEISVIAILSLALILFLVFSAKGNRSPAEEEAKRFARLLVIEIKLYNDYKVQRGLKNNNLYTSLQDEIEEARKAYRKRFRASEYAAYFDDALVNVLADGDKNKLGSEFNKRSNK